MHKKYIDMLVCPSCHNELEWDIKEDNSERVINASIYCPSCHSRYEVRDEIAVFLTADLYRNDLWVQGESWLEQYLKENPDIYKKLMNTSEDELNGADYWYKIYYLTIKGNYAKSTSMFEHAFEKIYTKDYIDGWDSQMNFIADNIKGNEPIIDIASGRGYLVEKLLRRTKNYIVATDFSPTVLVRNKEYYKFLGLYDRLSLIAFDARRTPFRDNSIDSLTSNMGLPNIEQPGKVISEMNRITKKEFKSVMFFIDKDDKVHMDLFNKIGTTAYATRNNAFETFKNSGWNVEICNSFSANIKPTPEGQIIKGSGIDVFPIVDTKIEFCVILATK